MLVRFVIGIPQIPFNKAPQPVAVEGARADPAAVHRTQDLEFANWIEAEALWDAVSARLNNRAGAVSGSSTGTK